MRVVKEFLFRVKEGRRKISLKIVSQSGRGKNDIHGNID